MDKPPRVNIIYDSRRTEKYEPLIAELKKHKIKDFEIWPCIMLPNVVEAINASFKMIVKDAKENGLKEVIIWEDDNYFPAIDGWKYFLANKPKDFDVYIGGTYLINDPHEYKTPLIKVNEWVGNHCIIVAEKYYDKFLAIPDKEHIDTAHRGNGDFYVCFPFAALQRPGFSANNHAQVNYNAMLNNEWIHQ